MLRFIAFCFLLNLSQFFLVSAPAFHLSSPDYALALHKVGSGSAFLYLCFQLLNFCTKVVNKFKLLEIVLLSFFKSFHKIFNSCYLRCSLNLSKSLSVCSILLRDILPGRFRCNTPCSKCFISSGTRVFFSVLICSPKWVYLSLSSPFLVWVSDIRFSLRKSFLSSSIILSTLSLHFAFSCVKRSSLLVLCLSAHKPY